MVKCLCVEVKAFSVRNEILPAKINPSEQVVQVFLPYLNDGVLFNLAEIHLEKIEFSESDYECDLLEVFDLRQNKSFKIYKTSSQEKSDYIEWKIIGGYQIPDSDFSLWHTEKNSGFLTVGSVVCTEMPGKEFLCWDNGNPAFSASGSKKWPTSRILLADGTVAAKLTTRKVVGIITSGNLFTGKIARGMSLKQLLSFTKKDGKTLIDWGIPFEARPKGFRVKFLYDGLGDECSIVATLEKHSNYSQNDKKILLREYVATAAYFGETDSKNQTNCPTRISEPDENGLRMLEVDFLYGKQPENVNPMPKGVVQVGADETITHVNVIFASSAHGDYFKGVKNATLIVKDFEFVY